MNDQNLDKFLKKLKCPECEKYMKPPIYQCVKGHNICEKCYAASLKCTLCKHKLTTTRNLILEDFALNMTYPCRNTGCKERVKNSEIDEHDKVCKFQKSLFECLICSWTGEKYEILDHWASKKNPTKTYKQSQMCTMRLKTQTFFVNLIEAYSELFWYRCTVINKKIYWTVQLIDASPNAENFCYEIEIANQFKKHQKIVLSDYCQSIDTSVTKLINDGICTSIHPDSIPKDFFSKKNLDGDILMFKLSVVPVSKE